MSNLVNVSKCISVSFFCSLQYKFIKILEVGLSMLVIIVFLTITSVIFSQDTCEGICGNGTLQEYFNGNIDCVCTLDCAGYGTACCDFYEECFDNPNNLQFSDFVGTWNGNITNDQTWAFDYPITIEIQSNGDYNVLNNPGGQLVSDLYPGTEQVFYNSSTNILAFQWVQYYHYACGGPCYTGVNFQVMEFNNGNMTLFYNNGSGPAPQAYSMFLNLEEYSVCDEINETYEQIQTGYDCEFDNDCVAIWGDCDVGLGGCHYSVNISDYPEDLIQPMIVSWMENQCGGAVCDCSALPNAVCESNVCSLAYCFESNPAGCFQTGCPDGYECIDLPNSCVSSTCSCDGFYGSWICTDDCNGGTCVQTYSVGDVNNDSHIDVLDIIVIVNFILQTDYPDNLEFLAADYNADDEINIVDVISIINLILNNLPDQCYLAPDSGNCEGAFPSFYYNLENNSCEQTAWGGCGGIIPFQTLDECINTCE